MSRTPLTSMNEYQALLKHYESEVKNYDLKSLFAASKSRFDEFNVSLELRERSGSIQKIILDYSKNLITSNTMQHLFKLASACNLEDFRKDMYQGKKLNITEGREVLHIALRNLANTPIMVDGRNVMDDVNAVQIRISDFVNAVETGRHLGYTGKKLNTFVNIGIGGSDLGPKMVTTALKMYHRKDTKAFFVSNVDSSDLFDVLAECDPETTLFIVASKTFTTIETMTNANTAREWFMKHAKNTDYIKNHFIAISTNADEVQKFGIDTKLMFKFWDWVGGRYSVWSSIGISVALQVGYQNYKDLLLGGYLMDQHFISSPMNKNIPVILGLIGVLYNNFHGYETHAILPYDQHLCKLAPYLQQCDMESNGKSVTRDNKRITDYTTGPIVWGEPGTNGQHAFYQLIHQGRKIVPADFLAPVHPAYETTNNIHHNILLANFIAQTKALAFGKTRKEVEEELSNAKVEPNTEKYKTLVEHKQFPGNRPTNSILYTRLTPTVLGAIIAMYEHKIFTQGVIWNINSFDQWGVELGKKLALEILKDIGTTSPSFDYDSSTNGLINSIGSIISS